MSLSPTTSTPTEQLIFPTPKSQKEYPTSEDIIFPSSTPTIIPTSTLPPSSNPIPEQSPTSTKEVVMEEISLSAWEEKTYRTINELREEKNLPTLEFSPLLTEIARERSLDMATRNYFSHTTPEGLMVYDLLEQKGLYPYGGELLFRTSANDSQIEEVMQETIRLFLESPNHQQVLLRPNYSLIGIGYALSEEDNLKYVTLLLSFPLK